MHTVKKKRKRKIHFCSIYSEFFVESFVISHSHSHFSLLHLRNEKINTHQMNADSRWFRTQWMFNIDPIRISALLWCCEPSFNFSYRLLANFAMIHTSFLVAIYVCCVQSISFFRIWHAFIWSHGSSTCCVFIHWTRYLCEERFLFCCNSTLESIQRVTYLLHNFDF